jgi:hypothetical protein
MGGRVEKWRGRERIVAVGLLFRHGAVALPLPHSPSPWRETEYVSVLCGSKKRRRTESSSERQHHERERRFL